MFPAWFKSLTIVHLLMGYIYLASGFIVSFLLLVGMVIWPFNKNLYRQYAFYLTYAQWSQFCFLAQWWADIDCILYVDPEDRKYIGKEHTVAVFNHTYEIDWLVAWMMSDRHGIFGNAKIYGKEILKYVPIQGWTWYFTESIFLKRNWEADKQILKKSISEVVTYPEGLWVAGTRWTPAKHEASLKIAREKGYPEYKRMLLPRTKGFALSMQLMKGKFSSVLDITIGFPSDEPEPTLMDAIRGKKIRSAMKIKRYEIKDIPADTEEECSKWLRDIYKQKDEDLDTYLRTGKFEGAPAVSVPKRKYDLYCYIFWVITTLTPLFYYLQYVVLYASITHKATLVAIILFFLFLMRWMIGFTEIKKGSHYEECDFEKGSFWKMMYALYGQ